MNNVSIQKSSSVFSLFSLSYIYSSSLRYLRVPKIVLPLIAILGIALMLFALTIGPIEMNADQVIRVLLMGWYDTEQFSVQERVVVQDLRLTRVVLAIAVGAGLAVTGAVYQGLFRNPLADPGLIGVSSGAVCGAVFMIVLGAQWLPAFMSTVREFAVPLGAFAGSLLATVIVYLISASRGATNTYTLLLAGIAISAICQAIFGMLTYIADDNQLRTLTFWTLGSLAGSTWKELFIIVPIILASTVGLLFLGRALDILLMGESVARHLGVQVEIIKRLIIILTALIVGCAVSVTGIIGFVGLVVPHLMRMLLGPSHRVLLVASALCGGVLLLIADTIARTLMSPAEVPVGLVTALIGGPFFLWLLLSQRKISL